MPFQQRFIPTSTSFNDPQSFRNWGRNFNEMLTGVGLVNTNASGSINWNTVVFSNPGSALTAFFGYEVFRFNDSLQSTTPIFMRIDYGIRNNNPTNINTALAFSFGFAHNNSGTLTSQNWNYTASVSFPPLLAEPEQVIIAGDSNWLTFIIGADNAAREHTFTVERTKDSNGNDTTQGYVFNMRTTRNLQLPGLANIYHRTVFQGLPLTAFLTTIPTMVNTVQGHLYDNQYPVMPVFPYFGGFYPACKNVLSIPTWFSFGSIITLRMYDEDISYFITGGNLNGGSGAQTIRLAVRAN